MRILLDTHMLLWSLVDDNRLGAKARKLITDLDNEIFYSAASIWEIAIKHKKSPARVPFSARDVIGFCDDAGFQCINVSLWHAAEVNNLKIKNKATVAYDPFDRMLLTQAKYEKMKFLTRDAVMQYYDEKCIILA